MVFGLVGSILFLACAPAALLDFAMPRWRVEDSFRIEDAYKHIYQATRGGEHAAPSREAAAGWLEREWESMGDEPKAENEWIPLCPAGEIGRLNLRPYKAKGGRSDVLVEAFLASSAAYRTEPERFTDAWAELGKRLKRKGFGHLTYREWQRLDGVMKKKGYPAIHHSDAYNQRHRPAYRILTLAEAQRLIPS